MGAIGFLFGTLVLVSNLLRGPRARVSGAYAQGQYGALVIAALLVVVGAYYFFKRPASTK
jgi:hypothetical protein